MNYLKSVFLILGLYTTACTMQPNASQEAKQLNLKKITEHYFELYKERENFEEFMEFYDENAVLEDIVYGNYIESKSKIAAFLNWHDVNFSSGSVAQTLVIQKQVFDNNIVVTEGYFTPFAYAGSDMGPWRFVIWLEFDQNNKIVRHVDWINYTPRANYLGGENLNERLSIKDN